jgi:uncharacterized repeat protein (TIGR03806 family)
LKRSIVILALAALNTGCSSEIETTFFTADAYPAKLSAWGVIVKSGNRMQIASDAYVYELNTPLFSDYAGKLRTLSVPEGSTGQYDPYEAFDFPVGTVVSKTFFYSRHTDTLSPPLNWSGQPKDIDLADSEIIETRLLVRQPDGWDALPYIWNGEDADLAITGDLKTYTFTHTGVTTTLHYQVPSRNECAACHATNHTTGEIKPIGLKARHLNRSAPGSNTNQIDDLVGRGVLDATNMTSSQPPARDARLYLDINCGHCHNPEGAADTSGLMLDLAATAPDADPWAMGVCKPPIAAGGGSGGNLYSIVPGQPDQSILSFRMHTTDPASRMPEIGRSLVHREGVALVDAWLADLEGTCI